MKSNHTRNQAAIKRIERSVGRYNLTINSFVCRANDTDFEYWITAARKGSGSRGGHVRCRRLWMLTNLYPDQRARIESLPKGKP